MKKPLILSSLILALFVALLAFPFDEAGALRASTPMFRIGDWNSSGTMEMPYEPAYSFAFSCQAQLTDRLFRTDKAGGTYKLYAIADFTFSNSTKSIESENLHWFTKKFYGNSRIEDSDGRVPFVTAGHRMNLSFKRGLLGGPDNVFLAVFVSQPVGPLFVDGYDRESFPLGLGRMAVEASVNVRAADDRDIPRLQLRVFCNQVQPKLEE